NDNTERVGLLSQTIDSFNGVATKLEQHYRHLERRVSELDIELRDKNKALETNLKEKEDVLESLTTGVVVIDLKGKITNFNRAAENITGLIPEKVREKKIDEVFGPEFFHNSHLDFRSLKDIQENVEVEAEIYRKDKNSLHLSISISAVKNSRGERVGTVIGLQDITRMKRLEEQAIRTDRLGGMEKMAEKIAHEIRNPLGSIELIASVLRKDLEDFGELRTLAEHISSGVQSINNIVSNLLLFISPQQKPDFQIIDMHDILNDSLFFSGHLLKYNDGLEVITSYSSKPLMIYGDSELLKHVCLNLILNAIQAMPNIGKLTISTREIHGQQKMQDLAEIRFADTGTGISREDMGRIFDPFFTTKKRGAGLGLTNQ
ncbi:MAG: PAS domain S-box protein, partial [Deltaproteobacteria bacterium]|nr:PAS domain S-box protein [Deltaproteobacteria bacterium]